MGDILVQTMPKQFQGGLPNLQSSQPQMSDEMYTARKIIDSYGGIDKVNEILETQPLQDNERQYIQTQLDILNTPVIMGGVQESNQPLYFAKPNELNTAFQRPLKEQKIKADIKRINSATSKNIAQTQKIKATPIKGNKPSEGEIKRHTENTVANMRSEWDNALETYKRKYGKSPSPKAKSGMRNALKGKYGNTVFYKGEAHLK